MTTHFPTVPVDGALKAAHTSTSNQVRPLALIANEDPMITSTLAAILDVGGIAVLTAQDGLAALETASVIPPQILIADLIMHGLNGLELARQVTRAAPDCEVILFVGNATVPGLQSTMRSLGCNFRILFKPVHPVELLEAIIELLGRRGHHLTFPSPPHLSALCDLFIAMRSEPEFRNQAH
jgi:DNA-binding response OmpR family regulator